MKTIYKYKLEPLDENIFNLRGEVLSAGVQGQDIMIWAIHDDDEPERRVWINVVGTGHSFPNPEPSQFVNTVFLGPLVFHIFFTGVA